MEPESVKARYDDGIAIITIDRPPVNALNLRTLDELAQAFDELERASRPMVAIITGKGDRAFAAGADIKELSGMTREAGIELSRKGHRVYARISRHPWPVIAAINGLCLGGGLELALACDIRVATESARFGQPEAGLGIIPGWGGTQRLPRLIGPAAAKELLFTGRIIDSQEALRLGILGRIVPQSELMDACLCLAREILAKAPVAVCLAKQAVDEGMEVGFEEALEVEARYFGDVCATEDMREGVQAFLEKRAAHFAGK